MTVKETAARFESDVHRIIVGQDETIRLAYIASAVRAFGTARNTTSTTGLRKPIATR